jgi:hypothetical protein
VAGVTDFRRTGDRYRYGFSGPRCIEAACWAPGLYQHRGATGSGSRSSGSPDTPCCLNRAYRGCPSEQERGHDVALSKLRKQEGWRRA